MTILKSLALKFILILVVLIHFTHKAESAYCYASIPEKHDKAINAQEINDAIARAYQEIGGDISTIKEFIGKDKKGRSVLTIDFSNLEISKTAQDYHATLCYRTGNNVKYACSATHSAEQLKKMYITSLSECKLSVNNYSDEFGNYFVLILTPSKLQKKNEQGDEEPISNKLHISLVKIYTPRTGDMNEDARYQSLAERFVRSVYGKLSRKAVLFDSVMCED